MTEEELLKKYQDKVDSIPEMKWCLALPEENAVKIIPYLIKNHSKNEDTKSLMVKCMNLIHGAENPAFVIKVIEEWKNTSTPPTDVEYMKNYWKYFDEAKETFAEESTNKFTWKTK